MIDCKYIQVIILFNKISIQTYNKLQIAYNVIIGSH